MKFIVFFIVFLLSFNLFSQNKDALKLIEGRLTDAKVTVDKMCSNPQTANDAQSWYLKAYVYTEIAKSEVYGNLVQFPGKEALKAISKCKELDADKKYYSDIINICLDLGPTLYNKGIKNYNRALKTNSANDYQAALNYFTDFYKVMDVLGNDKKFIDQYIEYNNVKPNSVFLYCGYIEEKLSEFDKAKEFYNKLIDLKSDIAVAKEKGTPLAYLYLSNILIKQGNVNKATLISERGVELYPDNSDLIINLVNIYKKTDNVDALSELLEKSIKNNSNDVKLLFTLAKSYNSISKLFVKRGYESTAKMYKQKAIDTYKKAIDLHPKDKTMDFKLNYNLGVMLYNSGVRAYKKNYEDRKTYVDLFTQAMPYMEKCHTYDKTNRRVMNMLMMIYQTLEMSDKQKQIENQLYK